MTRQSYDSASVTLSAATGFGGSFTVPYPTNKGAKDYAGGGDHKIVSGAHPVLFQSRGEFSIAFGASNMAVTILGGRALYSQGEVVTLDLERAEDREGVYPERDAALVDPLSIRTMQAVEIDLGSPVAADPDGICLAQSASGAHTLTVNGALAINGVVTLDVPRNVVVDSGGADTASITVTGTDAAGNAMSETITLNGATAASGAKAFKTITSVTSNGTIANGAFVGTGNVLGLPVFLARPIDVLQELEDGAAATAGTLVAGDVATATATTGDVRGTYLPNSTPNGVRRFELHALVGMASYAGAPQFSV
ncbi:MAG: hypothetical protein AAF674_19730 [Pseudomonadota bacterium]